MPCRVGAIGAGGTKVAVRAMERGRDEGGEGGEGDACLAGVGAIGARGMKVAARAREQGRDEGDERR